MRLIARSVFRAFRELDQFSDEQCRIYIHNATATVWRRAMRIAVNVATVATLVALQVRYLWPLTWSFGSSWPLVGAVALSLFSVGIGALVMRDLLLWFAVRRILRGDARCPACRYAVAGLVVTPDHRVTCPECGRAIDVSAHAEFCMRGEDGAMRFLPGPTVQLARDSWWTRRRLRAFTQWSAVAVAGLAALAAVPTALWEIHIRRMASEARSAAASLPPAEEFLASIAPPMAHADGDNAVDALVAFDAKLRASNEPDLLKDLLEYKRALSFWSRQWIPDLGSNALQSFARQASQMTDVAGRLGLIEALDRVGTAPAIRFPAAGVPDHGTSEGIKQPLAIEVSRRRELAFEPCREATTLSAYWLLDAHARGDSSGVARAFRALVACATVRGQSFPFVFSGNLEAPAQFMDQVVAAVRSPGGGEALAVVRAAVERNLRNRYSPDAATRLEVRKFQDNIVAMFGDPAVLRWRWIPGVRTNAYEQLGHLWVRGGPVPTKEPSALAFDFAHEWAASLDGFPAEARAFIDILSWQADTDVQRVSTALPPIAGAVSAWLPRWAPGQPGVTWADAGILGTLAIEEFRRDEGRLPASIDELVPKYLPVVPAPWLGMRYRPIDHPSCPAGYQLYFTGGDGSDDQCSADRDVPIVGSEVGASPEPN